MFLAFQVLPAAFQGGDCLYLCFKRRRLRFRGTLCYLPKVTRKGKRQGLSPAVPCPGPFSSIVWYPQCSPGLFFHIICALKRSYVLLRYLKWTEYHISWALTCDLLSFNQTFLLPGHQAIQYLEAICLKTSDFVFRKCEHILHIFYKTPDFSLSLCRLLPISECSENGNNR